MTRLRLIFSEALRSIGANLSTTFASVVSVLIGMVLIGVFVGIGTWLVSWSDDKKRELAVHVYIRTRPPRSRSTSSACCSSRINASSPVASPSSPRRKRSRSCASGTPSSPRTSSRNPLPASFDVIPKRGEDTAALAAAVQNAKLSAVDEVRHGKEVSERILQIARAIQLVFLVVVIVLLGASTILIANTIRLSIFARRREIEVMKLVGATNWFVRGPFMLEGVLTGLAGSVAAVALLFVGREIAVPRILGHIQDDPDVRALAFTWTAALLIAIGPESARSAPG